MRIQYHSSDSSSSIPTSSIDTHHMNPDNNSRCNMMDTGKNSTVPYQRRGRENSRRMVLLLPRHTKGVALLSLFIFAESVTYSNAVNFWSTFQKKIDSDYRNKKNMYTTTSSSKDDESKRTNNYFSSSVRQQTDHDCSNVNNNNYNGGDGTCSSSTQALVSKQPINNNKGKNKFFFSFFSSFNSNSNTEHCCNECYDCMDYILIQEMGCSSSSTAAGNGVVPTSIPRGGHVAAAAAVGAAAAATTAATTTTTPWGIPLNLWKIIFQFILTSMNVLCWLIPLKSKHISQNEYALAIANSFSGGVFLSLAFGHLIPECIHGFTDKYNEATPYMLVLAGYLLIFFVEKVAFSDAHDILHSHHHSPIDSTEPIKKITTTTSENGYHNHASTNGHSSAKNDVAVVVPPSPTNGAGSGSGSSGRGAIILLGALAVHSILEMMALGLADTFGDCALLTLSISLHQPAESIALLVAFLKSGMSEQQVIWFLSIFSCMGPIGVVLGMIVNQYAAPIVDSIMLAIVAGTFVYVGATEVIPEEFENSEWKWHKFTSLLGGIISIYAITQYTMTLNAH